MTPLIFVSAQDLAAWFDHFTKPADGWIGLSYQIPKVDATDCGAIEKNVFVNSALPMSFETCRQKGSNVAKWVRAVAFDDIEMYNNPKKFVDFLVFMKDTMPLVDSYFKKNAYKVTETDTSISLFSKAYANPAVGVLRVVSVLAKQGAKRALLAARFYGGRANHRVDPLIMLIVMGYLDTRLNDGSCNSQW